MGRQIQLLWFWVIVVAKTQQHKKRQLLLQNKVRTTQTPLAKILLDELIRIRLVEFFILFYFQPTHEKPPA